MDDANLIEKLDLKHSCFGKALLLEWRNGKTCCHACFIEYGKIEIFLKKWTLCPFNTDRFIGYRISAKKQRLKKE
jgi:hypothetical protein